MKESWCGDLLLSPGAGRQWKYKMLGEIIRAVEYSKDMQNEEILCCFYGLLQNIVHFKVITMLALLGC